MQTAFFLGALGALLAVVLKRWEQYGRLKREEFNELFKDIRLYLAAVVLVVIGGLGGIFAYQGGPGGDVKNWQTLFLAGAGSMMLIRSAAAGAAGQQQQQPLGNKPPLRDIIG
jgi:peptidoglycan/LPS O-acetylase OafA/YrhL